MKNHIAYSIKFIWYSGPDNTAEVPWNILDDHNVNQFLKNFVFFEKTMANLFHIFMFNKKHLLFSRNSTSSFDEQDVLSTRLWHIFNNNNDFRAFYKHILAYSFPMHPFSTPWKHDVCGVFRG